MPDEKERSTNKLLRAIVDLNRGRILSRLQSQHAALSSRKIGKPSVVNRLVKAMDAIPGVFRHPDLELTRQTAREMKVLFDRIENMGRAQFVSQDRDELLIELLRYSDRLPPSETLLHLLSQIPMSGDFNREAFMSISKSLGKLRRYYTACIFLVNAAKKRSLFNNIYVEITPPTPSDLSALSTNRACDLGVPLNRVLPSHSKKQAKSRVRLLEQYTKKDLTSLSSTFAKTFRSSNQRVHAEVQLIFFYEQNPHILRPRVICSNKSACYLCDLFIKHHGLFYTPSTHGRLYETWRLPSPRTTPLAAVRWLQIEDIVRRMNRDIEEKFRSTIRSARKHLVYPNESSARLIENWSPSVLSSVQSLRINSTAEPSHTLPTSQRQEIIENVLLPNGYISQQRTTNKSSLSSTGPRRNIAAIPNEMGLDSKGSKENTPRSVTEVLNYCSVAKPLLSPSSRSSSQSPGLRPSPRIYLRLSQGEDFQAFLSPDTPPAYVSTPRIHLTLAWEAFSSSTRFEGRCSVSLRWLNDSTEIESDGRVVPLNTMQYGREGEITISSGSEAPLFEGRKKLYLHSNADVVSIYYELEECP